MVLCFWFWYFGFIFRLIVLEFAIWVFWVCFWGDFVDYLFADWWVGVRQNFLWSLVFWLIFLFGVWVLFCGFGFDCVVGCLRLF